VGRIAVIVLTLPVAIALNALRIFLTGFLVFYVDPALAEGVMHYTEGWVMFVVAFAIIGALAFAISRLERLRRPPMPAAAT
jgi:exosortase/archaeosortase family protein